MGSRSGDETVEIECEIETSTAKAVKVYDHQSGQTLWIPKSQIHFQSGVDADNVVVMRISEWFAKKEGLV